MTFKKLKSDIYNMLLYIINLETEQLYSAWEKKDIVKFLKFVKKDNKELTV